MLANGLEAEARRLYPFRHLSTLNTVGYKEFFALWDHPHTLGETSPADAIKLNTWHYAKKQLTWLKKRVPLL